MVATVIPLLALAAILVVLGFALKGILANRRKVVPWEGTVRSARDAAKVAADLRDRLDRRPFGEAFARRVWARVMAEAPGDGAILHAHRDYCGHGLIRTATGVMLCEVQDAGAYFGPALAEWDDAADFVAFLARQSDFTCSGWSAGEPLFFTDDSWHRNNQRLTRDGLERYLARKGENRG